MKQVFLLTGFLALATVFTGCFERAEEVTPLKKAGTTAVLAPGGCPATVEFYAGQHIDVGNITVSNDANNIYVTFNTENGWAMRLTHLYAGPLEDLPASPKGNPKIGRFPYSVKHDPSVTSYTYTIPADSFAVGECIAIAAHAEAVEIGPDGEEISSETAWGAGEQIAEGGSWASYFTYCLCGATGGMEGN